MRRLQTGVLVLLAAMAPIAAQARNDRQAPVGMRGRIEEIVLPGSELTVAPARREAPIVLRILAVRRHGDRFRYDFEWSALEAGNFDLRDYLVRKDGSSVEDLPSIGVEAISVLEDEEEEPSESEPKAPPRVGGYGIERTVAVVVWILGLLAILLLGRRRRPKAREEEKPRSLADKLRPIVEATASGRADEGQKAELERLLLAFWRERLGLQDERADRALAAIHEHPEAGRLVREIENWLHMPHPPQDVDVSALLSPYREIEADVAGTGAPVEGKGRPD